MVERMGSAWAGRRSWPQFESRVGRVSFFLALAMLFFLGLRLLPGRSHPVSTTFLALCGAVLLPLLLVLLFRVLNRRLLWKVRNRLILTYVLMGLAPVVLFGTLTAIAGYSFAGQYSINSALASLDEASVQLKGETGSLASLLASPALKLTEEPLAFDEISNPREAEVSMARLQDGTWHTLPLLTKRGKTPPSPFDGQPRPAWLTPNFHGIVILKGRLYLCYDGKTQEDKRSAEVLGALELNHAALNSMATSLGRMLVFSGFTNLRTHSIDGAEKEAQSAESEAEKAQDAQEGQRDAQQQIREAQRDAQQQMQEAQRDGQQQVRDAQRERDQAQREVDRAKHSSSAGHDQTEARQSLQEAEDALKGAQDEAQKQIQAVQKEVPAAALPFQAAPKSPSQSLPVPSPLRRGSSRNGTQPQPASAQQVPGGTASSPAESSNGEDFTPVSGGTLPSANHVFDPRVYFLSPLPVIPWPGNGTRSAMLVVISRPSLLYTRLFATSVDIGSLLRGLLIVIALLFGLLELLALWMATRLSRTITRSVAGLYAGTTEIDRGNLAYRVKPDRQDQLGALANSFNTMAGSIQDLLVQQREKERLLSELAIAQEVQQNLFPHSPAFVTGLELHAVCVPARSVSGDYFDFIFGSSTASREGSRTCIALGDISGKGISAALLMASLHSAVRAFSLGEDDVASPARLLDLLNRHLYRSTTPEKYATLFLAFYDPPTRQLTYANGGHLPPLILAADGGVQRLEAGGSVVGLLDNLSYAEATVQLHPGDLLVAFSDGLTEPENEVEEFGEDRLLALLQQHRADPLPAITEATFRQLREWIGDREQPDDMTLLLARQL